MKQSSEDQLEKLTPLLKIVKLRQELYLQLLHFINKNIQSSSSQNEQLLVFSRFLQLIKQQEKDIMTQEKQIVSHFQVQNEDQYMSKDNLSIVTHVTKNNKQILRLCSRLIELLDASISKTRKSIFNENGRISLEFNRFKRNLHNIVKGQTVHLGQFTNHIISYSRIKYKKQVAKIEKYIFKLQSGAIIALRDLYLKEKSDASSPDEKKQEIYRNNLRESVKKIQHTSQEQSPQTKRSLKKPSLKSSRKGHKLLKSSFKKDEKRDHSVHSDTKPPKQYNANKLLKFYAMMDLSKKEFMQDYIYEQIQQQEHRKKLMSCLLQKNRTIGCQINNYFKKSLTYLPRIRQIEVNNYVQSSGEQKQQKQSSDQKNSMLKTSSLRKSFVISKRKSSLTFEKGSKILTEHDDSKAQIMNKTIKNFGVRRKSSQTSERGKSKKLFIIKSPVMFEDEHIPPAPALNTGGWFRAPLTTRKTQKKTDNLRLKRRNNPLPMDKSLFNQSFKFTDTNI